MAKEITPQKVDAEIAPHRSLEDTIAKIAEAGTVEQVEVLERMIALRQEMKAENAREQFFAALAEFHERKPRLVKNREAYDHKRGRTMYKFLDLDGIKQAIGPLLSELGFVVTYDEEDLDGAKMKVTATLHHKAGHSISGSAVTEVPASTPLPLSGSQRRGQARTYGRRYALIQVLDLTDCDEDLDGADPNVANAEPISDEQALALESAAEPLSPEDWARFLAWAGVEPVADLPANRYDEAMRAIRAKARKATKA